MRFSKILAVVAVLSLGSLAQAQTFRGAIRGAVTDESGAAVPGATVTATNTGTGFARTAVTDAQGNYVLSEMPLGDYSVSASLAGFKKQTVTGVHVDAAAVTRENIRLAAGDLKEVVEVVAGRPLVDTTRNVQGGTIEGEQAAELPVSGRDFTHLLSLVAGATSDPGQVSDSPGSFGYLSVNGNRGRANNFLLDGTDMNDGYRNDPAINEAGVFGTPATILPIDAVQDFPVMSGAEAEYGRNSGAIVNIVTKSGTNDFHGAAFEYFRDDALNARNYFNSVPNPKDSFRNHQFGASLGGPIVKDKTFFFLAYEGQRENVGLPSLTHVPSADDLAAAIAANGGVVNPVIAGLLQRNPWPAPNRAPDANGNNLETSTRGTNDVDSLIAKVDQHFGGSDVLTVRYYYGNSDQSFPLALVGGGNLPGYNTVTPTTVHLLTASLTHVISPKLLLEVRGGFNRFWETFSPEDGSFDPRTIGLNTVTDPKDFGLPTISVSGYAPLGANASLPRGRTDINYQAFTNLSYNTGRHSMKFGYEFRRTTVDGYFDAGHRGKLSFDSLDSFIAGTPSGGSQAIGDSQRFTFQNSHGFYAQDNFQASRTLTLNLGLRWDYFGVIGEEKNRFSLFDTLAGRVVPTTQLYPKDWNNFSPRLSAAWDVNGDGKTVVRGGWGLYYDAYSQDFFLGQLPWNTLNPGPAYNDILFGGHPIDVLSPSQPVYSGHAATDVFTVDPKLQTPWVNNYSVNVQRQLGSRAAIQVGYVGSLGRHLFRYRDLNQADPATGNLPYPDFIYINQFESTAKSHYNSLQAILKIRGWHGLDSTMSYTLGKSIDNASDGQDYVPQATQPDDSTHPEREQGPSNFDQRHRFTWYFTWQIGQPRGHWLTSGWAVNGVATVASGMPFNPVYLYEGDFNGSDEFFGRGDIVGDPFAGTNGLDKFLNLSAFQAPCTPDGSGGCAGGKHFGNQTRNAFYGPPYKNLDLSLVKNTSLGSRATLQIRVDFFNVLNHPNFANPLLPNFAVDFLQNPIDPATNRGTGFLPLTATPDVGTGNPSLGGGGPRNIQIAARLSF